MAEFLYSTSGCRGRPEPILARNWNALPQRCRRFTRATVFATLAALPLADAAAQPASDPFQSAEPPQAEAAATRGHVEQRPANGSPSTDATASTPRAPAARAGTSPADQGQLRQAATPTFTLLNRSSQAINEVYVSPSSNNQWGRDLLGQNVLPNGQALPVRIPAGQECLNDIRVVYASGAAEERRRVDTCTLTSLVFSPQQAAPPQQAGGNPSFNLVNKGNRTIQRIYASLPSSNSWGADRLGQGVLSTGRAFAVRLPNGECLYDIRVVYEDSSAQERRRVNTCELTTITFP